MSTKEIAVTVDYGFELRFSDPSAVASYIENQLVANGDNGTFIGVEVFEYDD